jgi:predicted dehydrogenase
VSGRIGVGFLGAGQATQAIHLPTLATLEDRFRVAHVMDADPAVGAAVAARAGARFSTNSVAVMDDPEVEVIAICSPNRFHADQIEAACRAGKRAILCEKPLATTYEEARRIADASAASGTPMIVGTMHAFDPAFMAARAAWDAAGATARLVRSTIYLPGDAEMIAQATEPILPVPPAAPPGPPPAPPTPQQMIRRAVLGLAIHNTPLVRWLVPSVGKVRAARFLPPSGYVLSFGDEERSVQMIAFTGGQWRPAWTFQAWGQGAALNVNFPPSYVLAGSAQADLRSVDGRRSWHFAHNGYQEEWDQVAAIVRGERTAPPVAEAVAELDYALAIADGAERAMEVAP